MRRARRSPDSPPNPSGWVSIDNARAVICMAEGDPAAALDVLRDVRDITPRPAPRSRSSKRICSPASRTCALGDRNAAAAAAEAALAAAEPDRLIFPFAMTEAAELLDALPRHETAHGALLADIVDLLRGASAPSTDRERLSQPEELSPSELRVLRYLPTNLTRPEIARELYVSDQHGQHAHPQHLLQARCARSLFRRPARTGAAAALNRALANVAAIARASRARSPDSGVAGSPGRAAR